MNLIRISLGSALAVGLVISASQLIAQDQSSTPSSNQSESQSMGQGHRTSRHHHRKMNPDRAAERMSKRYNLTQDQESQVRSIFANEQQQMRSLHEDQSMSKADRWSKAKSIHSDTEAKIEGVLNPEQKEKFQQDQQRRRERMARHHAQHSSGNAGGGTEAAPAPPAQ